MYMWIYVCDALAFDGSAKPMVRTMYVASHCDGILPCCHCTGVEMPWHMPDSDLDGATGPALPKDWLELYLSLSSAS